MALDVASEREANAELALFRRDPDRYLTKSEAAAKLRREIVRIDVASVARFLSYLSSEGRTKRYRENLRTYLSQWAEQLAGRDLREVSAQELKNVLRRWPTGKKNRIIAIKSFCSYLREEEATLPFSGDPTLALKVPAARPERAIRKKGYPMEHVQRLYRAMGDQSVRDVVVLLAKAGMHFTEVDRIARGEGEVTQMSGNGEIAATVRFVHKSGRVHTQSLDAQALSAAQRLQVRGAAPVDSWCRKVVRRAARSTRCDIIRFGQLRHSFVAWARTYGAEVRPASGGVPLSAISAAMGHASMLTTSRFYDVTPVPPMIKIPIQLEHPDDPVPLVNRQPRDAVGK
jgi:integrase